MKGRHMADERHDALMAVARALTQDEQALILAKSRKWPGMAGAEVADVLDHTVDYDEFLDRTEPFYETLPTDFPGGPGVIYALHSLILLGVPLTTASVRALLARAGLAGPPPSRPGVTEDGAFRLGNADEREARHAASAAVARALGDGQCVWITHEAVDFGFPRQALPATTRDVLEWLAGSGLFTTAVMRFTAEHGAELPGDDYPMFAMVALLALGRPLTMDTVTELVRRARNDEAPYDPVPDVAHVLFRLRAMGGGFAPSMAVAMANLKKGGLAGTEAEIEARLRALAEMGK
jgi:hypothetical protein